MRHIITLFISTLLPFTAFANPLSKTELEREFRVFKGFQQLQAHFSQTRYVEAWGAEIKTTGRFEVSSGQKPQITWEVIEPSYTAMKMSPEGLFLKTSPNPKGLWKPLKNPKVAEQIRNVFAWLSFDIEKLSRDFEVSKLKSRSFKMVPKSSQTHFKEIIVNTTLKNTVESISMHEANQDRIEILFKDTKVQ